MNNQIRRYVFVDFDTLTQVRFKKLEKVCDKVFVFTNEMVEDVPLQLVRDMQRMGANLKWVSVPGVTVGDVNYHVCFLMGKLHEKISTDIEFAILSNDPSFDPIVQFINSTGRSCIRVKPKNEQVQNDKNSEKNTSESDKNDLELPPPSMSNGNGEKIEFPALTAEPNPSKSGLSESNAKELGIEIMSDLDQMMSETARETVRRLLRSGNRPADVSMLKNYILLHNQEIAIHHNIEKIIQKLEENHNISVEGNVVVYNF